MRKRELQKELLRKIEIFEGELPSSKDYIAKEYLDKEGTASIVINAHDELQWFNPLSFGNQRELNSDIYDYIDKKADNIPVLYPIKIKFINCNLKIEDMKQITYLVKEHYSIILANKKKELKFNLMVSMGLTIFGAFMLSLYFALTKMNMGKLFVEIISIAGTFSLWEAVDLYLLTRKKMKFDRLKAGQVAIAAIEYHEK